MNPVEDRIRAATAAAGMAPVTAAAAVLAIGISLVIVRNIPNGRVVSLRAPVSGSGVPAYYVAIAEPTGWYAYAPLSSAREPAARLIVGETFTGKRLATVTAPRGATLTRLPIPQRVFGDDGKAAPHAGRDRPELRGARLGRGHVGEPIG